METRVANLENEILNLKNTLAESQRKTEASLERIIAVLNRDDRGKSTLDDEGDGNTHNNNRRDNRKENDEGIYFKELMDR
ncbi:hypothetical protein OROGR_019302 [Orobanche gracilis]